MTLLKLLTIVTGGVVVWAVVFQIVLPMMIGVKPWPFFRKRRKRMEHEIMEAKEEEDMYEMGHLLHMMKTNHPVHSTASGIGGCGGTGSVSTGVCYNNIGDTDGQNRNHTGGDVTDGQSAPSQETAIPPIPTGNDGCDTGASVAGGVTNDGGG